MSNKILNIFYNILYKIFKEATKKLKKYKKNTYKIYIEMK